MPFRITQLYKMYIRIIRGQKSLFRVDEDLGSVRRLNMIRGIKSLREQTLKKRYARYSTNS